jgi:hypothetical protein
VESAGDFARDCIGYPETVGGRAGWAGWKPPAQGKRGKKKQEAGEI